MKEAYKRKTNTQLVEELLEQRSLRRRYEELASTAQRNANFVVDELRRREATPAVNDRTFFEVLGRLRQMWWNNGTLQIADAKITELGDGRQTEEG